VPLVGGKNASLGEMVSRLGAQGVRVPNGVATSVQAYFDFLAANNLKDRIRARLAALDVRDIPALEAAGTQIREWITHASLPEQLVREIAEAYAQLAQEYGPDPDVAVRSSATAEDLPTASFAGQQDTFLNIRGIQNLLATCPRMFASLFNDRAISYRASRGFDHLRVGLSIGVQKMVRSDLGASGVMFTLDTETGFRDVVFINASYGLGENVVQGVVNPDEFCVFRPALAAGKRPIIKRQLGDKAMKLVYARDPAAGRSSWKWPLPAPGASENTSASADRRSRIFPRSPIGWCVRELVRFRSIPIASCP
jgi:pyruvate,water dikinase